MKPRHSSTAAESAPLVREPIPARRSRPSVRGSKGVKVETAVTINRPPEELFAFWRDFRNLPRVMEHIEWVDCHDERRSKWRVRRPGGKHLEWEAEIINEHPNELIAWRTLEGSDVRHAGSIRFTPAPGARGTEVKLAVEYEGGKLANAVARLFHHSPEQEIREDLRHFKQIIEAGEIPTIEGQPGATDKARHDSVEAK
jgi:uncharacterized membrane protein